MTTWYVSVMITLIFWILKRNSPLPSKPFKKQAPQLLINTKL